MCRRWGAFSQLDMGMSAGFSVLPPWNGKLQGILRVESLLLHSSMFNSVLSMRGLYFIKGYLVNAFDGV